VIQTTCNIFDIYFLPKLLTIPKKYLIVKNGSNRYSRYISFNRRINRNYKNNLSYGKRCYGNKGSRNIKKKLDLEKRTDKKNLRFKLLYDEIFTPLYENVVDIDISSGRALKNLIFTGDRIFQSNHHEEGLEHLRNDIYGFDEKFNNIRNKVNGFNTSVNYFQDHEFTETISNYLLENGFLIDEEDVKNYPAPRIILMSNLIPHLKSYWYEEAQFEFSFGVIIN
jgi:hypothetical protein